MNITLILLIVSILADIILMFMILKSPKKNQTRKIFILNLICLLICSLGQTSQILFTEMFGIPPIYFDYFVYIGTCFLPLCIFFTGLIYSNTKITFKKKYLLLFIIPIISLLVLWTNDFHHLFYEKYSVDYQTNVYGPYFIVHNIYSYVMLFIGVFYLLRFSIKNGGLFSKQSILIVLGVSIPLVINILGTFSIIPMSIYLTPISFTLAIILFAISILKFQFIGIAPIALQRIVDKMSDSYIVIDENTQIIDYNKTFVDTFNVNNIKIRGRNLIEFFKENIKSNVNAKNLQKLINNAKKSNKTITSDQEFENIHKYFTIEISAISSENSSLGTLILFKDITQHMLDMQTIRDNEQMLMERERLASLGQLIGGIAHNLKTPIMSISGAAEGLNDLVIEYDSSIDDPDVTGEDHHEIAKDMSEWIEKIKTYSEYMSDIITAVKGQAVTLSDEQRISFDIDELVKRVNILMRHELKNAHITLDFKINTDHSTKLYGNINSLVQVINNMITNAIHSYNGEPNKKIDLIVSKENNDRLIISIKDYGSGLPKNIQDKIFKEMVTTKGKNGTGLGLFMSYSTIRANFNGDITFETKENKGTTFNINLPIK